MPDFPGSGSLAPKIAISSWGHMTHNWDWADFNNSVAAATAWPTNNKALFCAFYVEYAVLAQKMACQVTTQSGNLDMGIYDQKGNLLVSKGSTAVGAAGLQVLDITDTLLLPGTYFMAMACSTTAAAFSRASINTTMAPLEGLQEMTTAMPLPSTATFANPSQGGIPYLVIQCAATI